MIEKLVEYPVQLLLKNGLLHDDDVELYRFGINRLVLFCINIFTTAVLGFLCGMIWESILFTLAYIPLRRFAGGYHAKTSTSCYVQSVLLILGTLYIIRIFPENIAAMAVIVFLSAGMIFKKAPMGSRYRPLTANEVAAFRKKTRSILAAELILFVLFLVVSWKIALCIGIAVACAAAMLVMGKQGDGEK